jgi:hypothetical protein
MFQGQTVADNIWDLCVWILNNILIDVHYGGLTAYHHADHHGIGFYHIHIVLLWESNT